MNYNAITVTELNRYIKEKISEDEMLSNILIKGEISNFKNHYTGNLYFTLKDENSLIKCIMFKSYADRLEFVPKDGMKVLVFGTVSVFERDGVYQIYCKAMKEDGIGNLYKEYEKLKNKLSEEGLFDEKNKKKIPMFPKEIGVLTSRTGAVIKDIINVSTRRNPNVHLRLLPVPVQGEGAAEKIAEGIYKLNKEAKVDVIIIARGGGSIEDLWPFNEEIVARAIHASEIPIISAVGHETDFTIADFASDLRAPTPSAAAELAVPNIYDIKNTINKYEGSMRVALKRKIEFLELRFQKCMASKALKEPHTLFENNYLKIDEYLRNIENSINSKIQDKKMLAMKLITKLDTLSPLKTLTRGYSIIEKNGEIVKNSADLKENDEISIRLIDGQKKAIIK